MAYNVKLTGDEVVVAAVKMAQHPNTPVEQDLAITFATIMDRSPKLHALYVYHRERGHVYPAKARRGRK